MVPLFGLSLRDKWKIRLVIMRPSVLSDQVPISSRAAIIFVPTCHVSQSTAVSFLQSSNFSRRRVKSTSTADCLGPSDMSSVTRLGYLSLAVATLTVSVPDKRGASPFESLCPSLLIVMLRLHSWISEVFGSSFTSLCPLSLGSPTNLHSSLFFPKIPLSCYHGL